MNSSNHRQQDHPRLASPFCRQAELEELTHQLHRSGCSAIFLSSEMGMGTTSLLRELAKTTSSHAAVISLQGTPSLASIPFGILAPFLRRSSDAFVESHVDAIRKTLALLDEQESKLRAQLGTDVELGKPLLIIDESGFIDRATAEVVVNLAQTEKIQVVVAHRAGHELVSPLPQLWDAGVAERFHLWALTREAGHAFCAGLLGGTPTANTGWYFWHTAAGNPLLMKLLMDDALANGKLHLENGLWAMDFASVPSGHQLKSVVREQLRGLSPEALKTLNLVALSEPVAAEIVSKQMGTEALAELFERHLLQETHDGRKLLMLINPVYGEVIREMVPRAQSRMLHSGLINELKMESTTPESALRMVIWTLESGLPVSDEELLKAAIFACKLYETGMALRLADEVTSPRNYGRAHAIKARARFNVGEYAAAAALLEHGPESAGSVSELMFGGLLRAATKSALGLTAGTIHGDASTLRFHADRLAGDDPENAQDILLRAGERANIIDLMAHSRTGEYHLMQPHIQSVLGRTTGTDDADHLCNRSMALALDAERLSALGQPVAGMARAMAAFAIVQAEDRDVYFVPEMIITRAQIASLTAGLWDEAEQLMQSLAVDVGKATISFGGSVGVARGMMLLRQGRTTAALAELLESRDALAYSDPQQLLGFCSAMAAYAAAKLGRHEIARELIQQYSEDTGMFIVVAHERAFIAAAREYLDGDGAGITELFNMADDLHTRGQFVAELNALALLMEFEPSKVRRRILAIATQVEGRWAAGLASYTEALEQRSASVLVSVAEQLLEAQMYEYAQKAIRLADVLLENQTDNNLWRRVHILRNRVEGELGLDQGAREGAHRVPLSDMKSRKSLTRRELEIALMAAKGFSDKHIALELQVSVRTVEGHLYRAYAKLGIAARTELVTEFLDVVPKTSRITK
ncbi:LuxR family transcriptional regulator [Arthrobacter sp. BF1]|uniref:LuxR C-terminal-related transcriptional regulator n=1 Tax=Arthrobacter sp. BF1 TaxID=2821145 RepID=UPI001C4EAB98